METKLSYENILEFAKTRKSTRSYYDLKNKFGECFTGNVVSDATKANEIIKRIENNSTAHGCVSTIRWAFELFYGSVFNPKLIFSRGNGISKFTSRFGYEEISLIREKFQEWIKIHNPNIVPNYIQFVEHSRTRIYHCFECLLASGMRIGELSGINFLNHKIIKRSWSEICQKENIEIVS